MQNITFKGNDYSKLYKEMEKITLHREEKIIPKNTLINKTSNNIQEKANKVNDVFVSKNKPEKLKTKDRNLFGTMVNTLVAVAISATLILGGKVLKFNYDHKNDYKILKDNKNKFNEKVNAYLMQYYNNEISSQKCEQKIKKATNEFKAVEQKINNKINKE